MAWNLSLKTRLRIPIVAVVALVTAAASAVNIQSLAEEKFRGVSSRAAVVAHQAESFVIARVRQRTALIEPRPVTIGETITAWTGLVNNDPEMNGFLEQTMASTTDSLAEVWIADYNGRVLASANVSRVGSLKPSLPDFAQWERASWWWSLREVLFGTRDYVLEVPLGYGEQVVFTIGVVLSPALMRSEILPEIERLGYLSLAAIVLAVIVAWFVSQLAARPLSRISAMLDRLGEADDRQFVADKNEAQEVAIVESKLNLLGQQFRDAKQDASRLRSEVEQMLGRLEDAVLLFDPHDRLVLAGAGAEKLLGKPAAALRDLKISDLLPMGSPLATALESSFALRKPFRDKVFWYQQPGSPPSRIAVTVEILDRLSPEGQRGTLVTLRDAETRRQIGSQLDIAARLAAISRLTGGVAHEIKNPLNSITLHLEILKAKVEADSGQGSEEIEVIAREIARLDRVVKTFLDFTRPVELEMLPVDLVSMIGELAQLARGHAEQNGVTIEYKRDSDQAWIRADRDLLKQALLNIVVNGIEAMPEGGSLSLELEALEEHWLLTIADEGQGIPPEIQSKIFNLYFTTKERGSGIGLAMTFRLIQLHSATIEFSSVPGKGTTFRIRIPAVPAEGPNEDARNKLAPAARADAVTST